MRRLATSVFLGFSLITHSGAQTSGAEDYALSASSVMWLPRGGSLFLNPAELARIRHGDLFLTTSRLNTLSSFSTAYFFPFIGTLAGGVATFGPASQFTLGLGRTIGSHHSFGAAVSGFRNTEETFGLSFGGSLHFPSSTEASGLHAAFSVLNISDQTKSPLFSVNLGAGYWIVADLFRLQAAFRSTPVQNDGLVGSEVMLAENLFVQLGTRSFKDFGGGISAAIPHGSIALSAGRKGLVLTLTASLTEPASILRSAYFELGQAALDDERYYEASRHFRTAYEYDRFFVEGRIAAENSDSLLEVMTGPALAQAQKHLENKRFLEATKSYSRVVRMTSGNPEAHRRLKEIQPQMQSYYADLVAAGDSLRSRREIEKARRSYQLALELDPGNDSLLTRVAELNEAAQSSIRSMLNRANSHLTRNQLDEAQREYERVLAIDSRNARALRGLEAVRTKRNDEILQRAVSAFNESNYMTSLRMFLQILDKDPRNREAGDYLNQVRRALEPEVDNLFRSGLQLYTKDNFKAAIEEWNKALLINPNHAATLEYRKRAEEKLQALERLK